jgi:hypothetical protein
VAKYVVSLCHLKHRLALFFRGQRMVVFGGRFVVGGHFFVFLPPSLSLLAKVFIQPLFILFLDFSPHVFYFLF